MKATLGWLRQQTGGDPAPTFVVAALLTGLMLVLFLAGFRPREKRRCSTSTT